MTAALAKNSESTRGHAGLRAIQPRRDMAAVARLIEISFAGELDPASRRMVREMRAFGRAGWLGWLIGRLFLPPAAYPQGFVWQEADQLVGNASLLPVAADSPRWVLANVAVHPDFRRRGIARRMVLACLDLAKRRQAAEVVLQVRHDNQGAIDLYRQLGFERLTTRTQWHRAPGRFIGSVPTEGIRRGRTEEWKLLWRWAQELYPQGVVWPYPLKRDWFEMNSLPGLLDSSRKRSWLALNAAGQPAGGVLARLSLDNQGWQLILLTPANLDGSVGKGLLARALNDLGSTGLSFSLSYPPDQIDAGLAEMGFEAGRTLTWMRLALAEDMSRPEVANRG